MFSSPLTAPLVWSIRLQPVPTMTSETTYGTKISTRISERPRIRRLSSSASPIAIGPWITSDATTMNRLCDSAAWNSGSVRMIL